jgi:proteasome lid subunit RPN8/RPN11
MDPEQLTLETQLDIIIEEYPETKFSKKSIAQIPLFPELMLEINMSKYPKKPVFKLPKKFNRMIKDVEIFLPMLRDWDKKNPMKIVSLIQQVKNTIESMAGVKVHLSEKIIKDLYYMAKSSIPNEMFCMLSIANGVLWDYVIAPGSQSSEKSVFFISTRLGRDDSLIATCHSHPNGSSRPSAQDLVVFRKKPINIIISTPFAMGSFACYNQLGEPIPYEMHDTYEIEEYYRLKLAENPI